MIRVGRARVITQEVSGGQQHSSIRIILLAILKRQRISGPIKTANGHKVPLARSSKAQEIYIALDILFMALTGFGKRSAYHSPKIWGGSPLHPHQVLHAPQGQHAGEDLE